MPQPSRGVSIQAIRNAAAEAVAARSLRKVAAEIGMSPTNLSHFLDGQSPYSATERKLNAWYVRHQLSRTTFSPDVARAGLAVLLEAIPAADLERATARVLATLREEHRESKVPPPPWLDALAGGEA